MQPAVWLGGDREERARERESGRESSSSASSLSLFMTLRRRVERYTSLRASSVRSIFLVVETTSSSAPLSLELSPSIWAERFSAPGVKKLTGLYREPSMST